MISWYHHLFLDTELFQGDIVLDPEQKNADGSVAYGAIDTGGRWKDAIVPYIIHESLQSGETLTHIIFIILFIHFYKKVKRLKE